MLERLLLLDF